MVLSLFLTLTVYYLYRPVDTFSQADQSDFPVIIIDPGHGGFDGGAETADGIPEKDINLEISNILKDYLDAFGFKTVMTRESDISVEDEGLSTIRQRKVSDLRNRKKLMDEYENCIYVCIHQNYFEEEKYSGMQVFYSPASKEYSAVLAQCIQKATVGYLQPDNERMIKACPDSVYIINTAEKPAVLVECGFLSNKAEAENTTQLNYQFLNKNILLFLCKNILNPSFNQKSAQLSIVTKFPAQL